MSALITTPNVEQIVSYRDQALIAVDEAFDAMSSASEKLEHARKIWKLTAPHSTSRYYDTQSEGAAFSAQSGCRRNEIISTRRVN